MMGFRCALVASLILLAGQVSASERISLTDFETATPEGWTFGTGATISTARAYSGTHSVRVENWYGLDKVLRDFGEAVNLPEVVFQWRWYTVSWDHNESVKFFRLDGTDSADNPYIEAYWNRQSSPPYYFWGVFRGTDNVVSPFNGGGAAWSTLTNPVWHKITVQIRYNTPGQADGIARILIDDVLTYDYTNKNYRGSSAAYGRVVTVSGNPGSSALMTNSVNHIDYIEVWNGLPDADPNPTPTPSPTPTPTPSPTPWASCDGEHLDPCLTLDACAGAGGHWCAGACREAPCAAGARAHARGARLWQ